MSLDATDRRLLSVLQTKGRISNSDLAEQVNMSASACHRRVGRLEAQGYIRDYVALVDPRMVDRRATVFVEITLSGQTDEVLAAFEKAVALIPNDPIINDHLGDALFRAGYQNEAKYQWNRALLYEPEKSLKENIEFKLKKGL